MYKRLALMLIFVLLVSGITNAQSDATRTLVLHQVHAVIEIPDDWQFNGATHAYSGDTGSLTYRPITSDDDLQTLCEAEANEVEIDGDILTLEVAGQPACQINTITNETLYYILPPTPFQAYTGIANYVTVQGNGLEDVIQTLQFNAEVTPEDYINSLIDLVEDQSYYTEAINWQEIRTEAIDIAENEDYPSALRHIDRQLQSVGDDNSIYLTPERAERLLSDNAPASQSNNNRFAESEMITENIGLIRLYRLIGGLDLGSVYVEQVHQHLAELDQNGATCYIVDLSQNEGGNLYSMLMGLASLIGDRPIVNFVSATGEITTNMRIEAGLVIANDDTIYQEMVDTPLALSILDPPVAVLQSIATASSGELTLLAFRGRENTRTFGQETAGLTILNSSILLYDGSFLAFATSATMDSTGVIYEGAVSPDEETRSVARIETAQTWLENDMGCQ